MAKKDQDEKKLNDLNESIDPLKEKEASSDKDMKPGPRLNMPEYDILPFKEATKRYVILSSQRTGSNFLCRKLCNVKDRFGVPSEYLHENTIKMMVARLVPGADATENKAKVGLKKYLKAVERARTSDDGYFGLKVQPHQLMGTIGRQPGAIINFLESFDRVILLTRKDKLGQAISYAKAMVTQKFFNEGDEPELTDEQIQRMLPIVASSLSRFYSDEQFVLNVGKEIKKPLLRIIYEDIEKDGEEQFRSLVDFLSDEKGTAIEEDSDRTQVPKKSNQKDTDKIKELFIKYISGE